MIIKKNGFTLVELLSVIVILAIILAIAIPSISSIINSVQIKTFKSNEQLFLRAAKTYMDINDSNLPINIGDTSEIPLSILQSNNYIGTIKDPYDNSKECTGYVLITRTSENGYDYIPNLNCTKEIDSSLEDGLIGYWKLDNGQALDYSLNNNNGLLYQSISSEDRFNIQNRALDFDGVDDYVDIGTNGSLGLTDTFTISLWVKFDNISSAARVGNIIGNYGVNPNFNLEGSTTGRIRFYWNSGDVDFFGTKDLRGSWHQVTVVRDKTINKITVYVDGQIEAEGDAGTNRDVQWPLRIGGDFRAAPGMPFHGNVDNVKIYNRALSLEEISYLYNIEK